MSNVLEQLLESFDRVEQDAQTLTFLPRATELQQEACEKVEAFLATLAESKAQLVAAKDENGANTILAMELSLQAVLAELRMWLELKRDQPDDAWNHLVTAQVAADAAIRVRRQLVPPIDNTGVENYYQKLLAIEQIVFPPQIFNSIGAVVRFRECTICKGNYDECPHIKGRAYMGELCATLITDLDLREISVVHEPADKRARVTHFTDAGGRRNRMTWKLE